MMEQNRNSGAKEQAEFCIKVAQAKIAAEQFKDGIVPIVQAFRTTYDEAKNQEFSDTQSFEFATRYILEMMFHNDKQ